MAEKLNPNDPARAPAEGLTDRLFALAILAVVGVGIFLLMQPAPAPTPDAGVGAEPGQPELTGTATADAVPATAPTTPPAAAAAANQHLTEVLRAAPVSVAESDHFVTGSQRLDLAQSPSTERRPLKAWLDDPGRKADSEVTVVRSIEQVEPRTPGELARAAGANLDAAIEYQLGDKREAGTLHDLFDLYLRAPEALVTLGDEAEAKAPQPVAAVLEAAGLNLDQPVTLALPEGDRTLSLREALRSPEIEAGMPLPVLTTRRHLERTTLGALAESAGEGSNPEVEVVTGPVGLADATVNELLGPEASRSEENVYYVRSVRDSDRQGVWGIVQYGLIENFARGIALKRGESLATYRVAIPTDADEREGAASSFLGRLIAAKVEASHVYNFRNGRMGQNPNLIKPGQELVIIEFSRNELVQIYDYFVSLEAPHQG